MSISVSRESISKLMTELVDTFPIESEGRSSISDFGKLLFAEGQGGAKSGANKVAAADSASAGSTRTTPPSDDDDDDDNDDEEEEDDDEEDEDAEDAKIAGAPTAAGGGGQKRVFTEIKGVPRQKQPDVLVAENGKLQLSTTSVRKIMKSKDKAVPKRWTQDEDDRLREAVGRHGERNWKSIAEEVPGRNHTQCLQRWTKVLAPGLVKGHWRPDEDELLKELVAEGRKNWGQVATRIPGRTSKQCRERWYNHLDPSIVRGEYSAEEDRVILEAQSRLGNRWSAIAAMLPGRTEDAVKIRWKSLCRVRKGQGARRSAQGGAGAGGDKGRAPTPKAGGTGGMMMGPPPHHMLQHHQMHPQLHTGGGSFSGGPIVKSEELGAFPATMRAHQQQQQHMSHLQYASAMNAQQQQMSLPGSGYHVISSSQPAMVYASDVATVYDPSTGQYRKQSLAAMQGGYGLPTTISVAGSDPYNIDRRANVVALSTPTHGYRGGGVATVGYTPAATAAYATDMDGNIYTTSAGGGGYVMASVYHPQPQMMSAPYGYSVPQTSASSMAGVAGTFAQQSYHSQQQQQQQQYTQEQHESVAREQPPLPPSQHHQQQQEQQQSEAPPTASASASNAQSGKSPAKSGAAPAPFNPAAMFAQAQQAKQQQQSPANGGAGGKPTGVNPVAAFLQQQQQKQSSTSSNGNGTTAPRPPFNPAAAFAQRFQAGKPPMPVPTATTGKSRSEPDDEDEDTENGDKNGGAEPSLKKVKPRLSIDAARASAARRMRTSGSGAAALAGRGSLDVFLNEIGDVGRLSDLKMDEFQTLDELWRVSDDMNRLSL